MFEAGKMALVPGLEFSSSVQRGRGVELAGPVVVVLWKSG